MSSAEGSIGRHLSAAERARARFTELFWNPEACCLRDCVDQRDGAASEVDDRIRPNQILALALPFEPLDRERAAAVLAVVEAKLLAPVGLRSLDPAHPDYRPRYEGGPGRADAIYHQGLVWSWLLGHYLTAPVRLGGAEGRVEARRILAATLLHVADEGCVGSVSKIFDAEPPHRPPGCRAPGVGGVGVAARDDPGGGLRGRRGGGGGAPRRRSRGRLHGTSPPRARRRKESSVMTRCGRQQRSWRLSAVRALNGPSRDRQAASPESDRQAA